MKKVGAVCLLAFLFFIARFATAAVTVDFARALGSSGTFEIRSVKSGLSNDIYVLGTGQRADFGAVNEIGPNGGLRDCFIATLSPDGKTVKAVTFFGGSGDDYASDMHIYQDGTIIIGGSSSSPDFPLRAPYQTYPGGAVSTIKQPFLIAFHPVPTTVNDLIRSSFLGGTNGNSYLYSMSEDGANNLFLVGISEATDWPAKINDNSGATDGFVAMFDLATWNIVFTKFVGGSGQDSFSAGAFDPAGSLWLVGESSSNNFPITVGAYQSTLKSAADSVLVKMSKSGNVSYASFLGGDSLEFYYARNSLATDSVGNIFIAGTTSSSNFPVTLGTSLNNGFNMDVFLAKFSPSGQLLFSTLADGSGNQEARGIVVVNDNLIALTGGTESPNFVTTSDALKKTTNNIGDGFIRLYSGTGQLQYSSFYGGDNGELPNFIGKDTANRIFVAGQTGSTNFPFTLPPSLGPAFVTKFSVSEPESAGVIHFSTHQIVTQENIPTISFTVFRSSGSKGEVKATLQTRNVGAQAGTDYNPLTTVLTWADGNDVPKTISLPMIIDNTHSDPVRDFSIDLSITSGEATVGAMNEITVAINDDENVQQVSPGTIRLELNENIPYPIPENIGTYLLKVSRINGSDGTIDAEIQTAEFDTNNPLAGLVYISTGLNVFFGNGDVQPQYFPIKIIDNNLTSGLSTKFIVNVPHIRTTASNGDTSDRQTIFVNTNEFELQRVLTVVNDDIPTPDLGPDLTIIAGEKIRVHANIDGFANNLITEWTVSSQDVKIADLSVSNAFERDVTSLKPGTYEITFRAGVGLGQFKTDSIVLTVLPAEGTPVDPSQPQPAVTLEQSINIFRPNNGEKASIHYTLSTAGSIHVVIYDRLGREVIDLADPVTAPGPHNLLWDGRDSSGEIVRGGTYTAYIKENEQARRLKIVVLD